MDKVFKVEHLLGVGSFNCKLNSPAEGFFRLYSEDNDFSLVLLDTVNWFSDYTIDEIKDDVDNWKEGCKTSIVTTISSEDGTLTTAVTNLAGPLIIDWDKKKIRQFVLYSGKYPLRAPLVQKGGMG